jgi:RNA polymerase sigma-70 factor (ECF subfamily)
VDDDDGDLVRRFREGDQTAFDAIGTRHRDSVYRFVRTRLGVLQNEAEDVTQDVLLVVYRRLAQFEGRSRLRTWILGVAANVCRERRRASASRRLCLDDRDSTETLRTLPDARPDLEAALDRRSLQDAVRGAMDALAPQHREVIQLREIEGLSYDEMATVLEIPVGTVRSRLHNARADLTQRLTSLAADGGLAK